MIDHTQLPENQGQAFGCGDGLPDMNYCYHQPFSLLLHLGTG